MSDSALSQIYDVGLFDLDGVVYSGHLAVPHAAESIAAARANGMRAAFVTNNASRTPQQVLEKLAGVGVPGEFADVITSAQVAADVLARRLPSGASVLVVGDTGLREAVSGAGLRIVESADDQPQAVVQGHSPNTGWQQLSEAAIAIRAGALWVASNGDLSLPSDRGILPGNGAFVRLLAELLGRGPDDVAGKPERTMHRASVERTDARRPLVIGDRLDTDIEGAARSECDSLYVMTGVSTPADVLYAIEVHRPTLIATDLRGLLRPVTPIADVAAASASGRWQADPEGAITASDASSQDDPAELLSLLCALHWNGKPWSLADDAAREVAHTLGITGG